MKALFRLPVRLPSNPTFLHTNSVRARLTRHSPFIRLPSTNISFSDDAVKKLDNPSQKVGKNATNSVPKVNKHIPSTLQTSEHSGEEAGKHVGATADNVGKAPLGAENGIGKHAGPATEDVRKKAGVLVQKTWKRARGVVDDAKKLKREGAAGVKSWIKKHPKQAAGIAVRILAPPLLAIAAVPLVLGGLGFTAKGVASGSIAAGIQAAIGNVVHGSLFSILQGAAAGGGSAVLVKGVVGGIVLLAAVRVNIPRIIKAVNKAKAEEKAEGKDKEKTEGKDKEKTEGNDKDKKSKQ